MIEFETTHRITDSDLEAMLRSERLKGMAEGFVVCAIAAGILALVLNS